MVAELVLHIGDCTTGSTAIQSALSAGRYVLPRGGTILYPAQINHNQHALTISDLPEAPVHAPFREARFRALAKAMTESDADWGVISAELFEFVKPAALKAVLDEFFGDYSGRTRIIAYVQPHHGRIVSGYAEALKKSGGPPTMAGYFDRRKGAQRPYYPRFSAWKETFGEAFTAKVFHPDRLRAGDVAHDFIAFATQQPRARSTLETIPQSSLSLPDLAMMREVHARIMELEGGEAPGMDLARRQIGWHMAPILGRRYGELDLPAAETLRMPRPLAQRVADHFREDAAAMDADFFQGTPLTKALDDAVQEAIPQRQSLDAESYFDAADLARIRAWAEFVGRIAIADPQAFFWASMPSEERAAHMERARAVDGTLSEEDLQEGNAEGSLLSRVKDKLR